MMEYYIAITKNVLAYFQAFKGEKQSAGQYAPNSPIYVNKKEYIC